MVTARICHDLANPIGAIGNGMELVRELGPEAAAEELDMIGRSAARANAALSALRLAFGGAPSGAEVPAGMLASRMDPYLSSRRVSFECDGQGALSPAEAQLAALMSLAARALLGLDGRVRLTLGGASALPLLAEALGPRAAWSAAQRDLISGTGQPEPRSVEFALLSGVARAAGARLEPIEEEGRAGIRAEPG